MKGCAIFIIVISFVLSACKKYDEGGLTRLTRRHLFGGSEIGDSKTWKLKRYEVNGIDSTYLIQGTDNVPDFYNKFIRFRLSENDASFNYYASTYFYLFYGGVDPIYKRILFTPVRSINKQDSFQCYSVNSTTVCVRNIFFPEIPGSKGSWRIEKLTRKEFIISASFKNNYKIILSQ